jgi:hypothetical protein
MAFGAAAPSDCYNIKAVGVQTLTAFVFAAARLADTMRLRLFLRRLTISSPRMSVHSALTWPIRVGLSALVLGFCAAIGLWAFEFGKDFAGLDRRSDQELVRLQTELAQLRSELSSVKEERDQAQSVANTSVTLVTAEKSAQERLQLQVKQLEEESRSLRDDLGFFEKLIPAAGVTGVAIRGLQAEVQNGAKLKWQVLVIQANKNAIEFNGLLELTFSGTVDGKPWTSTLASGPQAIKIRQYGRLEGEFDLPAQTVVKMVTAKVLEGSQVRSTQSIKL